MIHRLSIVCSVFMSTVTLPLSAQVAYTSDLYKEMMHLDSIVFVKGYNQCQTDEQADVIAEDLEMYHDITGVSKGKEIFLHSTCPDLLSVRVPYLSK